MAIKDIKYQNTTIRISYTKINRDVEKNMIFLHGWGSNKELMAMAFKESFMGFNHIYIDLPGFGGSDTTIFLNSYDYANVIKLFLQEMRINKEKNNIVVGHSFGGKIALLLDYEIILLSSAGILLPKPFSVRAKIMLSKILKFRIFKAINSNFLKAKDAEGLNPIMYEIFKHVVNEDFSKEYANFSHKATIFWGKEDTATPLESFHKITALMPKARAFLMEGDHYFFLKQADKIQELYHS